MSFSTYLKSLELKIFNGKLHQKATAPHPGQVPDHVWLPVEEHDHAPPAPGQAIQAPKDPLRPKFDTLHEQLRAAEPPYTPPAGLVASGNAIPPAQQANPVEYDTSAAIPAQPHQIAPQPADVAALKGPPTAHPAP